MDAPRPNEATTVDADTPVAIRARRVSDPAVRRFLAEADRPAIGWETGDAHIVARGAAATIETAGAERFRTVRSRAELLFDQCEPPEGLPETARPRLYGGFAFTERGERDAPWDGFPAAWFVLPAVQLVGTGDEWWLTAAEVGTGAPHRAEDALASWTERLGSLQPLQRSRPPGIVCLDRTPSRDGWQKQVRDAVSQVDRGELEKVVLAQSLTATLGADFDVSSVLERLGEAYADCYRFVVAPPGAGTFFGATPERLVTRRGRTVETEALAGSTGRGDAPAEDEWLAEDLRDSPKDRHEHQLAVDAIREQLEPLAANVRTGPLSVRRLATVQHLRTPITAELHTDDHVLDLVEALHPTPTVGGLPPERALATIREAETFDRGWYAGPIGWFDGAGDGEFAVAIRAALARADRATCFAGAGIVADSDPDREWDEVQLKYRPILDALE